MKKKNEITSPKLKKAIKKLVKAKKRLADTKNKDRQPVQGGTQYKNIQHDTTHANTHFKSLSEMMITKKLKNEAPINASKSINKLCIGLLLRGWVQTIKVRSQVKTRNASKFFNCYNSLRRHFPPLRNCAWSNFQLSCKRNSTTSALI